VTDAMTSTIERIETSRTGAPALTLRGVGKTFGAGNGAVTALRNIDLHVEPGEFVCLLGASGCGKSTLLNLVADLDAPTTGSVELGTARPSFMFQEAALLPWLTARRNVELALQLAGQGRRERRRRAEELLSLVRLDGQGDKRPHELSGGMRQRVSLARALAATTAVGEAEGRPGMLLMDEPFAALDALTRRKMQQELLGLWEQLRFTVLFVTHSIEEAIIVGSRILVLSPHPGRVRAEIGADAFSHENVDGVEFGAISKRIHRLLFEHEVEEARA
jgi:NitT/TauT family transport system ATP-binding protein